MAFEVTLEFKQQLLEDGVALATGLLDREQLDQVQALLEWSLANPGPLFRDSSTEDATTIVENFNPKAQRRYREEVPAFPFGRILKDLWECENVWYYGEEIFHKEGPASRTVWHQDVSVLPWDGRTWMNCWISLDPVPKRNCLEVIRGSHRGTLYDATPFSPNHPEFDPDDPTKPFWGDRIDPPMPRLPHIEKERAEDPTKWDIVSFDVEPGDVLFMHPRCLHGGAPTDAETPRRRTLVLRFFGDEAVWRAIPQGDGLFSEDQQQKVKEPPHGEPGTPFRAKYFRQVA